MCEILYDNTTRLCYELHYLNKKKMNRSISVGLYEVEKNVKLNIEKIIRMIFMQKITQSTDEQTG